MIANNDAATTINQFSICILDGMLGHKVTNCKNCQYKVYGSDCYRKLSKQCLSLMKKQYNRIDDLEYELQKTKKTN